MIFAQNQVSQAYIVKALKEELLDAKKKPLSTLVLGDAKIGSDTAKSHFYLQHFGQGGLTRSDLIDPCKVIYANKVDAAKLERPLCIHKVQLASSSLVVGEDYVLRIDFSAFPTRSQENTYSKDFAVHAFAGMNASTFYKKMAIQAAKSFAREAVPLVTIKLETGGTAANQLGTLSDPIDVNTKESDLTNTYTGIVFEEVEQPWRLGMQESQPLNFTLHPTTIYTNGDDVIWGSTDTYDATTGESIVGLVNTNTVKNGKKTADFEYFTMKNRADQYGNMGYPDSLETKYLVDPSKEYDYITIHYFYDGSNESVQKSEKDLVIITEKGQSAAVVTALNKVLPADKQIK